MILLISSNPEVKKCAPVLSRELGERVECVENLRTAASRLREHPYEVVVLDQVFAETQASAVEGVLAHAAPAVPLFFNPAVNGTRRLALEARSALKRGEYERRMALETALASVRNDLRTEVTGILLSSHLALSGDPPEALAANLKSIRILAERLSKKLT
jgi:signal transduction histidine kinase